MEHGRPPRVSVLLPVCNGARFLDAALESVLGQTFTDFEVVVVDDGSTDGTPELLASAGVRVLRHEQSTGPARARNDGWRAAHGRLIAFTDDDIEAEPWWLERGWAAWGGDERRFVQGRTDPDPEHADEIGPFSRTLRVHALGPHYQTCNVFYPRALLEAVDGFDTALEPGAGEDSDLAWRCLDAGAQAVFAPGAQVFHAVHQLGPRGKLRIATLYSRTVALLRRHPGRRPLVFGVFWHHSHFHVLRALAGLVVPRRGPWRALRFWCFAHLVPSCLGRARDERGAWWTAPYFLLYDAIELVSVVRGAIRHRVFVL